MNLAGNKAQGVQIAGLANIAGKSQNGVAIGGLMNVSAEKLNGAQVPPAQYQCGKAKRCKSQPLVM